MPKVKVELHNVKTNESTSRVVSPHWSVDYFESPEDYLAEVSKVAAIEQSVADGYSKQTVYQPTDMELIS